MAADIYKRKGCSYIKIQRHDVYFFFFLTIFQIVFHNSKLAEHKTSQVKPSELKNIHSQA